MLVNSSGGADLRVVGIRITVGVKFTLIKRLPPHPSNVNPVNPLVAKV
jgi:hypothetical protein